MKFAVDTIGVLLITAIIFWFWFWKSRTVAHVDVANRIDIVVANGVYKPDAIEIRRGDAVTLNFHREDASPCAEQVIFHGLNISETLPLGKPKEIQLIVSQSGTYRFTCQMQMYQGTLIVVDA
jgi:plastocyanin domain-containing protein